MFYCLDSLDSSIIWSNPCNIIDNKDNIDNLQDDLKVTVQRIISTSIDRSGVLDRLTFLSNRIVLFKGLFSDGLSIFEDTYCKLLDQYIRSLISIENSNFDGKKWGKIKNNVLTEIKNIIYNNNVICC